MKEFFKKIGAWIWGKIKQYKQFFIGFVTCLALLVLLAILKGC